MLQGFEDVRSVLLGEVGFSSIPNAIALNGVFFNTQRMVWQYFRNAYRV